MMPNNFVEPADIPQNQYGAPTKAEHIQIIKNRLESNPCPVCKARPYQQCKGTPNIHSGRVPDYWDSITFLTNYFNGYL